MLLHGIQGSTFVGDPVHCMLGKGRLVAVGGHPYTKGIASKTPLQNIAWEPSGFVDRRRVC